MTWTAGARPKGERHTNPIRDRFGEAQKRMIQDNSKDWRRKREFGWPVEARRDGSLVIRIDSKIDVDDILYDKDAGSNALPRAQELTKESDVARFLGTFGNTVMVLDPSALDEHGQYALLVRKKGQKRYLCEHNDTVQEKKRTGLSLTHRTTYRISDKKKIEHVDVSNVSDWAPFTGAIPKKYYDHAGNDGLDVMTVFTYEVTDPHLLDCGYGYDDMGNDLSHLRSGLQLFRDDVCYNQLLANIDDYRHNLTIFFDGPWYHDDTPPDIGYFMDTSGSTSDARRRRIKHQARMLPRAAPAPDDFEGWLIDTGTTYHLQALDGVDPKNLFASSRPIKVRSAGGLLTLAQDARIDVPCLGDIGKGLITKPQEGCPNALSVGRLVQTHGCIFMWYPNRQPLLVLPDGTRYKLCVRKFVPYLANEFPEEADSDDDNVALPLDADGYDVEAELGTITDDDEYGVDGDQDCLSSYDSCKVPPKPMQRLKKEWSKPAIEWEDDASRTSGAAGSGDPYPPTPDHFEGWPDAQWDSSGDDGRPDTEIIGPKALGKKKVDWQNEAKSTAHLLTHRPANKYCWVCRIAKARHRRHKRHLRPRWKGVTKFGDIVTFDHLDCKEFSCPIVWVRG